jgi:hypothetical protein
MKRRPKPEPVLADGERPPCGFLWHADPDDGHLFSAGCACALPYVDHERFREIWRTMAAAEVDIEAIRRQLDRALADGVQVRQRVPLRTGVLHENGKPRRYLLDGEAIEEPAE